MNKKEKNRKLVKQNKRNRIINRRYTSTIKSLSKLIRKELSNNSTNIETKKLINSFFSIVDKAVKKGVIHKNKAARKKSKISNLSTKIS